MEYLDALQAAASLAEMAQAASNARDYPLALTHIDGALLLLANFPRAETIRARFQQVRLMIEAKAGEAGQ